MVKKLVCNIRWENKLILFNKENFNLVAPQLELDK